jgi:hypothetical protein
MLKTLLYIDEDLASSIALRFTDYLHKFIPLSLYVIHVEQLDEKEQVGTGWIRHTWEDGVCSSGKRLVDRMLRTENIDCPLAGRPKVFVEEPGFMGEKKDREVAYELGDGMYDLFIKGYLDSANPEPFYELITSRLTQEARCPVLVVKNLSLSKKCALLCADSVDPKVLVEKSMNILGDSSFDLDLVFFKFKENEELVVLDQEEGGKHLRDVESLLAEQGKEVHKTTVLSGTPEQVGDYLKEYAVVASTLPSRKSMRMYVLAHSLASVLLVR